MGETPLDWVALDLPVPPPSRRSRPKRAKDLESSGVRLLHEVADVLSVVGRRSAADFRPLPTLAHTCVDDLQAAFSDDEDPLPMSLLVELAPLLQPRLERLAPRLRRRLGRLREELPIGRLREMDPACMRRNARRPGRTLLDKAGPRQRLTGVRRIPRFDTTENRILKAACHRIAADCASQVAPLPLEQRRHPGRAARLRGLRRMAEELVQRPELVGIGRPRPGERASNALLGDADYRSVWRAWKLLRAEEARFSDDWAALEQAWREMVLLAAWQLLDRRPDLEPLPAWVRVRHARTANGRIEASGSRQWVWHGPDGTALVSVHGRDGRVGLAVSPLDGASHRVELAGSGLPAEDTGSPSVVLVADRSLALARARRAVEQLPSGASVPQVVALPDTSMRALSALETQLQAIDETGVHALGPVAAGVLVLPDEAPMAVVGRPATWLPEPAGPAELWRGAAAQLGDLLRSQLATRSTALVVPDAMGALEQADVRRGVGPIWMVPAPVAAGLSLGLTDAPSEPESWLVVVHTSACLDIAVLERKADPDQPELAVWIRSAPGHDSTGGQAEELPVESRGAWLRGDEAGLGLDEAGALRTRPVAQPHALDGARVEAALASWQGRSPTRLLVVAASEDEARRLGRTIGLSVEWRPPSCLVAGAWCFLQWHSAERPTWKDRLASVELLVGFGRQQVPVPLVAAGHLVAPGQQIVHRSDMQLRLSAKQERIRFPIAVDGSPTSLDLAVEGPPLPLRRDTRVRAEVSYTHGMEGLTATLLPVEQAPFTRLRFQLSAANDTPSEPLRPPPRLPAPGAPSDAEWATLLKSAEAIPALWRSLGGKDRKKASQQAGALKPHLERALQALAQEARWTIRGVTTEALPESRRADLRQTVLPWLAWLGGVAFKSSANAHERVGRRQKRQKGGSTGPAGRPPKLTRGERVALLDARAKLRWVPSGDRLVDSVLAGDGVDPKLRRLHIGLLASSEALHCFRHLLELPQGSLAEEGALAEALTRALEGDPELVGCIEDKDADQLARRLSTAVRRAADSPETAERGKHDIYRCLQALECLCQVRHYGRLFAASEVVRACCAHLSEAKELLSEEVLKHGDRSAQTKNNSQLVQTLAALRGQYGDVARLETGCPS